MNFSFNPYFAGSSSGREHRFYFMSLIRLVSILILLEVALEDLPNPVNNYPFFSFNPYFAGSSSGSKSV